jgi:ubiquinone/menaquinone biosynthesis C-methylase UbiE
VVGIDMSPEMIRVARARSERVENLEFELADAMQ